jgi:hypothetical protein
VKNNDASLSIKIIAFYSAWLIIIIISIKFLATVFFQPKTPWLIGTILIILSAVFMVAVMLILEKKFILDPNPLLEKYYNSRENLINILKSLVFANSVVSLIAGIYFLFNHVGLNKNYIILLLGLPIFLSGIFYFIFKKYYRFMKN